MIDDYPQILAEFSKHFNSRFNSLDFMNNANELVNLLNGQKSKKQLILLSVSNQEIFKQLKKYNYQNLLYEIISRIKIEEEAHDVYTSEIGEGLFNAYEQYLIKATSLTEIIANEHDNRFELHCPSLLRDLIFNPIAQLHNEIVIQLNHFNEILGVANKYSKITGVSGSNIFINSKVPTPYSYFVIAYLAENLNIPLTL